MDGQALPGAAGGLNNVCGWRDEVQQQHVLGTGYIPFPVYITSPFYTVYLPRYFSALPCNAFLWASPLMARHKVGYVREGSSDA